MFMRDKVIKLGGKKGKTDLAVKIMATATMNLSLIETLKP